MDSKIVNCFVESTVNCFELMLGATPEVGEIFNLTDDELISNDISAIIGLTGQLNGWIAARFSKATAIKLVSTMICMDKTELDEDVQDAAGEIVNIIAGGAKSALSILGVDMKIAIPSIVVGPAHELGLLRNSDYTVIPFKSSLGDFSVELCIVSE